MTEETMFIWFARCLESTVEFGLLDMPHELPPCAVIGTVPEDAWFAYIKAKREYDEATRMLIDMTERQM